jgi:predicted ATPase/class 3 adenylate cyclase
VAELPSGTVTFLFTDLEGSTRLWEEHPEAMKASLARHDEILRGAMQVHDGCIVKTTGDGALAVFSSAADAVVAAIDAQLALGREVWGSTGPLRVRMGLHTGTAELRGGDYYGVTLNRAARIMSAAHGGQVVCSQVTEELVVDRLPVGVTTRELGVHRLRDLASPVRLAQLAHPELPGEFPPLKSLDAFAGNLPLQVTSFVGRDEELTAIAKALDTSPIVTLTGTGGVGKTRVAIQAAAEVLDRFRDGAWLCELAGAADDDSAVQVVAETLRIAKRPGTTLEVSVVEAMLEKQILVVLDNCEHVLDVAGRISESLVQSCPEARVLATSREALAVPGEQVLPVRPLATPDAAADPNVVAEAPSARLFTDRARGARPTFAIDAHNAESVGEICRRVDGIPLAVELAAARIVALSAADIAAKLDERFRLLAGGRRGAVDRHQTLRATVDWSYSLLDDRDRAVFDRLSVFMGGFDIAAAEAVAADDEIDAWDVVDALTSLVAKSMVAVEERPTGGVRYLLLETLRQYALDCLNDRGLLERFRRRHADHFARFAEELGPQLLGAEELVWRERYREEIDNLRAALTWALDSSAEADGELAVRIVAALAAEAAHEETGGMETLAERALDRARRSKSGQRCAVLGAAAWSALRHHSDFATAIDLAREALDRGVDRECPAPQIPYVALGLGLGYTGNFAEVRVLYEEAKRVCAAIDAPPFAYAFIQSSLAFAEATSTDGSRAAAEAEEALRLARALGNPTQLSVALYVLALTIWQDEPVRARIALEESIAIAWSGAGAPTTYGMTMALLAQLQARTGDAAALHSLREGLRDAERRDRLQSGTLFDRGIQVCAALGIAELAIVLAGIIENGPLTGMSSLSAVEVEDRSRTLDTIRTELGDKQYAAAFQHGAAMTYDESCTFVLDELDRLIGATAG